MTNIGAEMRRIPTLTKSVVRGYLRSPKSLRGTFWVSDLDKIRIWKVVHVGKNRALLVNALYEERRIFLDELLGERPMKYLGTLNPSTFERKQVRREGWVYLVKRFDGAFVRMEPLRGSFSELSEPPFEEIIVGIAEFFRHFEEVEPYGEDLLSEISGLKLEAVDSVADRLRAIMDTEYTAPSAPTSEQPKLVASEDAPGVGAWERLNAAPLI